MKKPFNPNPSTTEQKHSKMYLDDQRSKYSAVKFSISITTILSWELHKKVQVAFYFSIFVIVLFFSCSSKRSKDKYDQKISKDRRDFIGWTSTEAETRKL